MKRALKITGLVILAIIIVILIIAFSNMKDRHRGYSSDQKIINNDSSELWAGFAAVVITPEVYDRWVDANKDAEYNPGDGDTFSDGNSNGRFDPVWIAGFGNKRAANGIHDDLWARTMVIDDGKTRIAIVALDAIGFMNDDVIDVRKMIPAEAGISYALISSTHAHEVPDLIGMWGSSPLKSGVDRKYLAYVKNQIVRSVENAVSNLRTVRLEISENMDGAAHLVKDTRDPQVFDSGLRIIRAVDTENGNTLGTLVSWADHPETLWGKNLLITSDFPHYVREGIEKGVYSGDSLVSSGTGAVTLYVNGAIGGLMTTHPSLTIKDPFSDKEFSEPSFEKAEAQGKQLALLALKTMSEPAEIIEKASISLISRTLELPIDNKLFRLATAIGVFDRGTPGWMKMRTELAAFTIGSLSFAALPGEVYPEIVNGGIESPEGNDLGSEVIETPAVRNMMPGRFKFILGLANDEIGYIIPKSQWDVIEPFTYGRKDSPYGEENSLGPSTAPELHRNLGVMLRELQ